LSEFGTYWAVVFLGGDFYARCKGITTWLAACSFYTNRYIMRRDNIGLFEAIASCLKWVGGCVYKYIYYLKTSTQISWQIL